MMTITFGHALVARQQVAKVDNRATEEDVLADQEAERFGSNAVLDLVGPLRQFM
jgi:hypothetical protein